MSDERIEEIIQSIERTSQELRKQSDNELLGYYLPIHRWRELRAQLRRLKDE